MTITPVVGVTSMPRLTPYMSVDMFKTDGRRGVAVSNLVAGGKESDQDAALAGYLEEASARVDSICQQTLAATVDTYAGRYQVHRDGLIYVHPRYQPVIALLAFAAGSRPGALMPYADLSSAGVYEDYFTAPLASGQLPTMTSQGPLQFGPVVAAPGTVWCTYTYVNGYPVTTLTADLEAGGVVVPVADTTGIVPGNTWLTIYAGARRHRFLAQSLSNLAGGASVASGPGDVGCAPLPWSISNNSRYPVQVSALPADVIEATAYITRAFIKDAATGNVSLPVASSGAQQSQNPQSANDDMAKATAILAKNYIAQQV